MEKLLDPQREDISSFTLAIEVANLIQSIVDSDRLTTLEDVVKTIQRQEAQIMKIHPLEFIVENVIRRIMTLFYNIQKEKSQKKENPSEEKSFTSLKRLLQKQNVQDPLEEEKELEPSNLKLRQQLSINSINNFKQEKYRISKVVQDVIEQIDGLSDSINIFASTHIQSNEIVVTYGYSTTILNFLVDAQKQRNFEVIVFEGETKKSGEQMAVELSKQNITTFLVPFSASYAFMSRVNQVFIGVHAIMKNGGAIAQNGLLMLATAAKAYSVPVLVLAGAIQLTPYFPFEQNSFNKILNPKQILSDESELYESPIVIAAKYDYLSPDYITLFITNEGEITPAYIYRLFNEFYYREKL